MFLIDDQVMLNRSLMSKYGFALGEVTLSLKRGRHEPTRPRLGRAQRVWIIGASSGIGAALATRCCARGAHVAVSARRAEALQALARRPHGSARTGLRLHRRRPPSPAPATNCSEPGAASTWWCSAPAPMRRCAPGSSMPTTSTGCSAINLRAPMAACARLIPRLLKQGSGALAFVSSVAGYPRPAARRRPTARPRRR
jgi:hypothetical protein